MKHIIFYKDKEQVNTNKVNGAYKGKSMSDDGDAYFYIRFTGTHHTWIFDNEFECKKVHEWIMSQMTEIELDYHPDLENE